MLNNVILNEYEFSNNCNQEDINFYGRVFLNTIIPLILCPVILYTNHIDWS